MMMALGFLAADFVINSECRRQGLNRDFASSLVVWAAIGAIACSRLYAVIDDFPSVTCAIRGRTFSRAPDSYGMAA